MSFHDYIKAKLKEASDLSKANKGAELKNNILQLVQQYSKNPNEEMLITIEKAIDEATWNAFEAGQEEEIRRRNKVWAKGKIGRQPRPGLDAGPHGALGPRPGA
jgi:hypothetical protein